MNITNKKGTILKDLESWKKGFVEVDKKMEHWRKGYSAYSLADFLLNHNGLHLFDELLQQVSKGKYNMSLAKNACIEHESKFDNYKSGRMQDLAILGEDGSFFIGVEAKVDEPFSGTIQKEYNAGVKEKTNNTNSKKAQRVLELVKRFYNQDDITEEIGKYRYQLLHYLAGSMAENYKLVLMPILVFHTKECPIVNGPSNKQDYIDFMRSLNFNESRTKEGYLMFSNIIDGIEIYSFYIEIDLKS